MVVVEIEVVRQCDVMVIVANPDIIHIFIRKMRKYLIYIVLIDFN